MTTMEAMQAGSPHYETIPNKMLKADLEELESFLSSGVPIIHPAPYLVRRAERAEVVMREIEIEAFGSESPHSGYQTPWKVFETSSRS